MIITLAVAGYRSLRDLVLPLDRLNVVTGPNGSGKSSVYRSIRLLADIAQGRVIASIAAEGGLQSTLWAGPEQFSRAVKRGEHPIEGTVRRDRVRLQLGFASDDFGYAIDLGLPSIKESAFTHDPEIKAEAVWAGEALRRSNVLASRRGPGVHLLGDGSERETALTALSPFDSMMTHAADPRRAPELMMLRERMRAWRFYDHFRTDRESPARQPQIGTRTPVLASTGADLAASVQTIREIGDHEAFDEAIDDAFPGSRIDIAVSEGLFSVAVSQHGLLRPLAAAELSDGTLRYLLLATALLSPRPPSLLVLNEPETSLHPELLEPLARLIVRASDSAQLIVVTHAEPLVRALAGTDGAALHELRKELGETVTDAADRPPWNWPER